jgi:PAS domain S-box-containing protein
MSFSSSTKRPLSKSDSSSSYWELIDSICAAIRYSPTLDAALTVTAQEIVSHFNAERCAVVILDKSRASIISHYHSSDFDTITNEYLMRIDYKITGKLADEGDPSSVLNIISNTDLLDTLSYNETAPDEWPLAPLVAAPVAIDSEVTGAVIAYGVKNIKQSARLNRLIQYAAFNLGLKLSQARLQEESRANSASEINRREAIARKIDSVVHSSLDIDEILQVSVEEAGRALGVSRAYFRQRLASELPVVAEYVIDPHLSVRNISASLDDYISSYLLKTRRPLIIDDVRGFLETHSDLETRPQAWQIDPINLSQLVYPIFTGNQFWGAISVCHTEKPHQWTSSEVQVIEAVAMQIEAVVNHAYIVEEARRAARREALISHLSQLINQTNRLDRIFQIVAHELGEYLSTDKLCIIEFDEDMSSATFECEYSNGKVSKSGDVISASVFEYLVSLSEDGLLAADDVAADPRFLDRGDQIIQLTGARSMIMSSPYYNGPPRFAIAAIMTWGKRIWESDEIEVVRAAAEQVFTAIERVDLFDQVSRGKFEWESTFDALTDGIFIFDHRGILRRVNQAAAIYEGVLIQDLLGRQCCSLLQGIEGEECRVLPVIETGRPVTFELVPGRLKRPMLVTISPIANNKIGDADRKRPYGAVCIVRDLSELRAAEAVAREQRNFLVNLIEHASDALFTLSPDGSFIWFNDQLIRLSGYSREELKAGDNRRFFGSKERLRIVRRFKRALAGEAQTFEMHGLAKNGEAKWLLVTYTPVYDEGVVTSILAIARDVTEEKIARERSAQAEKLRALGQLASGVAHNFNNILAAILGHAQLLKRESKEENLAARIDIIERAALDGAQTVKRIQGFGHKSDGDGYRPVDLNQLVLDSTTLTQTRWRDDAQARGFSYEVTFDPQLLPLIKGSESELREVFVNLIFNALDAMPKGGRLRISTRVNGTKAQVRFTDSGIGMSREVRQRIFEPFFTTKGTAGTGLGLAVSYSIIERHRGQIDVHSIPRRGSTFIISFPTLAGLTEKDNRARDTRVGPIRILVIDDEDMVRKAISDMLVSAGHFTDQASTGREAIEKMASRRFDMVFTDLSMPESDGWAVARELKNRWPEVKVVMTTGYDISEETIENDPGLIDEIMLKPIHYDDLCAVLSKMFS